MPVPSIITDLNVDAASNSPAGTDSVTAASGPDEYFRAINAIVRREQAQFTAVASAATVDLGAIATGNYGHITGTVTITSFGTVAAGISRVVVFDGALTLTHNAISLILPGGANIVTAAGDVAEFVSEGLGNWRCKAYQRKAVPPGVPLDASVVTAKLADDAVTYAKIQNVSATDKVLGRVSAGAGDIEEITCTPFARTLLDDADAATARTTLGLQASDATLSAIADESLGPFAHRNKIINGNFDIWQRGTSQTTSGYGSADRWLCGNIGSTKTASRQAFTLGQTDVPGEPTYFMRHVVTSVAGASNYVQKNQPIESVRTLAGKNATVTFWAKADAAKNMAIEFYQGFGTGGAPSADVSAIGSQLIALTTTWQKFTKTIAVPSISGKTLGTNNNDYLAVQFWFDAGTDFNTRAANLGQQSGTFDIAQVQVEEGSVATPFEQRPLGYELELCARYYEKSAPQAENPNYNGSLGRNIFYVGAVSGGQEITTPVTFEVKKRGSPAITLYDGLGNSGKISVVTSAGGALTGNLTGTAVNIGDHGFAVLTDNTTVKFGSSFYWSADAEL